MKKLLAAALALSLGFASCEPEPEPLTPVLEVGQSEISFAAEGGLAQMVYSVTNPVAGEAVGAEESAEWLTVVVGERTIEFTATANDGSEERSAEVTLSYKGAESKSVTVKQSVEVEPIVLTIERVDATVLEFSAKIADSNMRWIPMVVEKAYWNPNATDEELFQEDLQYLNYMATYEYGCSLSQFIEMITFVGTPSGILTYDSLTPETDYVLYAYGLTLEGERTTDIVKVEARTTEPYEGDITFDINLTEQDHVLNIKINPSHPGVNFYYDIITDVTLAEWKARYGTSDLKSSVQAYIDEAIEDYLDWGDIYSPSEYYEWYGYTLPVDDYFECTSNTNYIVFACKWDENCQLVGELSYKEHTSETVQPSSNTITLELSDPSQTSVRVKTTTTNNDPYVIMGIPSSEWEGYSDDEIFAWIMGEYGTFYITDWIFEGGVEGKFSGMEAGTEYTFVAFGYEAGVRTTDYMAKAVVTTLPAGDPKDCTFEFAVEAGSNTAYVDILPSDAAHWYYWMVYPANYTADDVKANIEEVVDEWYYGDIWEFAYWELVQGAAGGEVSNLKANTEYKVAVVIMDDETGEYLSDVVFSDTFKTREQAFAECTVTLQHDKYYDGDEIAALGGADYSDYAGKAILPVTIKYTGEVAEFFFTIFQYAAGMEDPALFDDSIFYASLFQYGNYTYESLDFALGWEADYLAAAVVVDYDGNYSPVYRAKVSITKDGVSPAEEYLYPDASAPKKSAVAWSSFNSAAEEKVTLGKKVAKENIELDSRFSERAMKAKRAEAKAQKEEARRENLKVAAKARKSAPKADKWEPRYLVAE